MVVHRSTVDPYRQSADAGLYECPGCGQRTSGDRLEKCPNCGDQPRNLGVPRDR